MSEKKIMMKIQTKICAYLFRSNKEKTRMLVHDVSFPTLPFEFYAKRSGCKYLIMTFGIEM